MQELFKVADYFCVYTVRGLEGFSQSVNIVWRQDIWQIEALAIGQLEPVVFLSGIYITLPGLAWYVKP